MKDINTVKSEAEILMAAAARFGHNMQQTHAYEVLARLAGYRNWSTYRAQLEITPKLTSEPSTVRQALNEFVRWCAQAPIAEFEDLEAAIGNPPLPLALDALNSAFSVSVTNQLLGEAARTCWDWLESAPLEELEAVEALIGDSPRRLFQEAFDGGRGIREDIVKDVVDDVRERARDYGFSHSGYDNARELALASAEVLNVELTDDELEAAIEALD